MNPSKSFLAIMRLAALRLAVMGFAGMLVTHAACAQTPSLPAPAAPQVDAAFAGWDLDRNGSLSLQEFRNGWLGLRRTRELEMRLHAQFRSVDSNHNEAIDASEYASLLLVKRAGKAAPALSTFDANHDQRLEFGEYLQLVRRMTAPRSSPPAAARKPS